MYYTEDISGKFLAMGESPMEQCRVDVKGQHFTSRTSLNSPDQAEEMLALSVLLAMDSVPTNHI